MPARFVSHGPEFWNRLACRSASSGTRQAVAGRLDDLDLNGLYFGEPHDVINIQAPEYLGDEALRAEICATLATRAQHPGAA